MYNGKVQITDIIFQSFKIYCNRRYKARKIDITDQFTQILLYIYANDGSCNQMQHYGFIQFITKNLGN